MGKTVSLGIVVNDDASYEGVKNFGKEFGAKVAPKEGRSEKKYDSDGKPVSSKNKSFASNQGKTQMQKICIATIVFSIFAMIFLAFGGVLTLAFANDMTHQQGGNVDVAGCFSLAGACFAVVVFALFIPQIVSGWKFMVKNKTLQDDIWMNVINTVAAVLMFVFVVATMVCSVKTWNYYSDVMDLFKLVGKNVAYMNILLGLIILANAYSFVNKRFCTTNVSNVAKTKRALCLAIGAASIFAFVYFVFWVLYGFLGTNNQWQHFIQYMGLKAATSIAGCLTMYFLLVTAYTIYIHIIKQDQNFKTGAIVNGTIAGVMFILFIIIAALISVNKNVTKIGSIGFIIFNMIFEVLIFVMGIISLKRAKKILPKHEKVVTAKTAK